MSLVVGGREEAAEGGIGEGTRLVGAFRLGFSVSDREEGDVVDVGAKETGVCQVWAAEDSRLGGGVGIKQALIQFGRRKRRSFGRRRMGKRIGRPRVDRDQVRGELVSTASSISCTAF